MKFLQETGIICLQAGLEESIIKDFKDCKEGFSAGKI